MSPSTALNSTQQQVIALIAAGSSARAAAEPAGVYGNTIANWLRSFEFRR